MPESVSESVHTSTAPSAPVMRRAGTGRGTWAMQSLFEHLVEATDTDGAFGAALVTQPPGVATPLHVHAHEAEAFFMLEGTMDYRAGEEDFHLDAGCFMYLPAGLAHAFRIRGEHPAKFLALTVPGGLLSLYDEVGVPATELRLPGDDGLGPEVEIPKWVEVAPRYGLSVVGPPIPE